MGWNHAHGWRRRRRFKENLGGRIRSAPHGQDTIELSAMAASAFVVLVVGVAGAGVFAAVTRQLSSPLEVAASSRLDASDAARASTATHDEAGDRSHKGR